MVMMNLFNEPTGFRLARLELYNWGTFHNEIWTMQPDAQTAVLTGVNGSGKSTVVDALLTLLVEHRKRNYNMASGTGNRGERQERTYVRGQYSRSRSEDSIEAKANSLRGPESHSVLLAVFLDPSQQKTVTLAQILWLSNVDRVEKRFYVAPFELTIEKHFGQRHITGKHLPDGVQTFGNSFSEYIRVARKLLGLNGKPKALDLFNQTVAVKDITGLNSFVREHMLDKGNPDERVEALRTQYRELNDAHVAIQKAARQLGILAPLVEAGREYRRYETQIERYEAVRPLIPFYVAGQARKLLTQAIETTKGLRTTEQSRLETVEAELESLRHSLEQVKFSIAQNSVGQMKREIESRLPSLRNEIDALKRATKNYDQQATLLGWPVYQNEDDFHHNRKQARVARQTTQAAITELESQRTGAEIEQADLVKQAKILNEEIEYLRQNLSNIPRKVALIREEIGAALGLSPDTLTFAGELLRVRNEDAVWEGALERLLHSFAQDLLVPEDQYAAVSRFVNSHNLRGRLVYRRIEADHSRSQPVAASQTGEFAFDKVQIKQDTPYHDWLAAELMRRFNYVCCVSLADFQQAERAITREGQIKHNRSRHEKDDRHNLNDRSRYVLGWDNRQKLHQLETELDDVARQTQKLAEQTRKIKETLDRRRNEVRALENLLDVTTFASIDWRSRQIELDRLENQLANLDDSELRNLEQQQEVLQEQVQRVSNRRDEVTSRIAVLNTKLGESQQALKKANATLETVTEELRTLAARVQDVFTEIDKEPLTIEGLNIRHVELETSIRNRVGGFRGHQNRSEAVIIDAMRTFRREYADEGAALTASIDTLAAFEQIHRRLESDDLPKYEARFKAMLDRTVTRGVIAFYSNLTEQERQIERSIDELNDSLAKVDYGSGSTIRLIAERTRDPEINDFRRQIEACIPDAGDNSREELERAFDRIKRLIEQFDNDPGWMRRVIDVRRWREFSAEQIDADGRQVDYYTDSSGKSGGQKAKLAYTILASAIAYQYGLQDIFTEPRSFRFVVIDEAFSKLDDDNARFAMQLFDQLGLQLLVVTPMQQLHIIENYVHTYHLVVNNAEGNHSRLFNLSHAEYVERRREFLAEVQTP
ncbi:MAG: Chromosome partition protein Smc [Anaerolineae bacterium]|nr:Chromosome partition protein Smc [Anaerolineae bacterium]